MADVALEIVIKKLVKFTSKELQLLHGAQMDAEEMKMDLEAMRSFLKDVDLKRDGFSNFDASLETRIKDIRDLAYDTEDVLDQLMAPLDNGKHHEGPLGWLMDTFDDLTHLGHVMDFHHLAGEMKRLKKRGEDISKRYGKYSSQEAGMNTPRCHSLEEYDETHRKEASFVEDTHIIAIDKDIEMVVRWLIPEVQDDVQENSIGLISLTGMGGIGKTTLAKRVYNDIRVKSHFELNAWVSVTRFPKFEDILKSVLTEFYESVKDNSIPSDIKTMDSVQLQKLLFEYLDGKRYILVLDDVWGGTFLDSIVTRLPKIEASRVLITSRIQDVASRISTSIGSPCHHEHGLKPLSDEASMILFCKIAFRGEADCPKELRNLCDKLLHKCGGLPLAIRALAGIVSSKTTKAEWQDALDRLGCLLDNSSLNHVKNILSLSYKDLPSYLKRCFQYCSLFPEDYFIPKSKLIRLWMAEGFVEATDKLSAKRVGEWYLEQLVTMSMIQVAQTNHMGRQKAYRVHDLLRELVVSVSSEENFGRGLEEEQPINVVKERRLAIYGGKEQQLLQAAEESYRLRSFMSFDMKCGLSDRTLLQIFKKFRVLKVLDLKGAPIKRLPDELGHLFRLRYLGLRYTGVTELPQTIRKLQYLQTLDVKGTQIEQLPDGVSEILGMEYVSACTKYPQRGRERVHGCDMPSEMFETEALYSVTGVNATTDIVKNLGKAINLVNSV